MLINDRWSANSLEISKHLKDEYYKIYNCPDRYRQGSLSEFLGKYSINLGSISDISAQVLELDILLEEVKLLFTSLNPIRHLDLMV